MELKDTIPMMCSDDYKERFRAEYYQLKIRTDKLCDMLGKWERNELDFEPANPKELLISQLASMFYLLGIMLTRANNEKIDL